MKVKSEIKVAQSYLTLCGRIDGSPPGSSIRGIFQARVLEWGAIAFSENVRPQGFFKKEVCDIMEVIDTRTKPLLEMLVI